MASHRKKFDKLCIRVLGALLVPISIWRPLKIKVTKSSYITPPLPNKLKTDMSYDKNNVMHLI